MRIQTDIEQIRLQFDTWFGLQFACRPGSSVDLKSGGSEDYE